MIVLRLLADLRNQAKDTEIARLKDILNGIHEGDTKLLDSIAYTEGETAKFRAGFGTVDPRLWARVDVLIRMRELCRAVEAERDR